MSTNSKRSEHKSCGCGMCRRGAGTVHGQTVHKQVNRELHDFVRDYLVARGYLGVEIQTEW